MARVVNIHFFRAQGRIFSFENLSKIWKTVKPLTGPLHFFVMACLALDLQSYVYNRIFEFLHDLI